MMANVTIVPVKRLSGMDHELGEWIYRRNDTTIRGQLYQHQRPDRMNEWIRLYTELG